MHHARMSGSLWQRQSGYKNGFPSDEEGGPTNLRLTDPDWYPQSPLYYHHLR
jgi:hypothetical protein